MKHKNTLAVVTAGGESTRMGTDKGLVDFLGRSMISYVVEAAQAVCRDVIILANQPGYENLGFPVYPDLIPNKGPMGGLYTALKTSEDKCVLYLACDLPNITGELLQHLMDQQEGNDAVVPSMKGQVQPLCALYEQSCLARVEDALQAHDVSMMTLLRYIDLDLVELDGLFAIDILKNYNSLEELPINSEEHVN